MNEKKKKINTSAVDRHFRLRRKHVCSFIANIAQSGMAVTLHSTSTPSLLDEIVSIWNDVLFAKKCKNKLLLTMHWVGISLKVESSNESMIAKR